MVMFSTARKAATTDAEWTRSKHQVQVGYDFWCPTCQNTSQESCDTELANTTCRKADFCIAFWDKTVFTRKCVNRIMLKLLTGNCRNVGPKEWKCNRKRKYQVTACDQSGCRAGFSEIARPGNNNFWCPTCQSTSQESCDATLTNTACPKADFCMALWDKSVFARKCVNRKMLELMTRNCMNVSSNEWKCNIKRKYQVAACDQSGCVAEFSENDNPDNNNFWCPTCDGTSQESCDATLNNTSCPKADFCMTLLDRNVFARKCVNRKMLEVITKGCRNVDTNEWRCHRKRNYHVTACDRSGCKAEFSELTKSVTFAAKPVRKDFWCPTCQDTSQESCDAALANTTCRKADFCIAFWDKTVFTRKCVNNIMLKLLTGNCKNVGPKEWKCNRKRKYQVTACDQSGCRAEFSEITGPGNNNFWCPTCDGTSQESCDATLYNTTCSKANFCMALWNKNLFARKCANRKMLEVITNGCRYVASNEWQCRSGMYQVTWCDQSGCKAEFSEIARSDVVVDPVRNDFWCPTCDGTSQESCDATLNNTNCPKADFCMTLLDRNVFARKCVNRKMLEVITKGCRNVGTNEWRCHRNRNYHVTACDQSGCRAEFSELTKSVTFAAKPVRKDFWCPTCQSSSQESCDASLNNTSCPKADLCMALWDKNVFVRKCVNKIMLKLLTGNCRNVGSKEWECNRKRKYHVTACDQSGCKAKVSGNKFPKETPFQCPTCPMCKSRMNAKTRRQ
ncbi:hypothetical protein OS493_007240 [Desmophyllum pertusum]|uniref:Uncharacterized protein n=1 Tax=Desmophyllum pertusum TaxID=174260 RepID=A0A9X0D054_9CNID|nr:hypothetical protein OS493_007240 [Desmophyllum pertusum]